METDFNSKYAIFVVNADSEVIIEANNQAEILLEKKSEEIIGLRIDEILFSKQNKKSKRFLQKIKKNMYHTTYISKKDGKGIDSYLNIKAHKFLINNQNFIRITIQEASNQSRLEQFILGSSIKQIELEEIINQIPFIVIVWQNQDFLPVLYVSKNIIKFGYTTEEIYSNRINFVNMIHPYDINNFLNEISNYILQDREDFNLKCRIITKSGEIRWIDIHIWVRKDDIGEISHFQGIILDITEHTQALVARKESEENYRNLVNSISDAIIKIDLKGTISYVSPQMSDIFGFKEKELIGMNALKFVHPEDIQSMLEIMKNSIQSGDLLYQEFRGKHKNGNYIPIAARGSVIKEEGEYRIIGVLRDITEQKEAEKKLKESEHKYRLAYNRADFYKDLFAHDMNNILHYILSSIELYSISQKKDELLNTIELQAQRGAKLISNVQKLSNLEKTEIQTEETNIYEYLEKAIKFVKESFQDRNINILIEAKKQNISVKANELLLDVFENILINSVKYNNNNSVLVNIIISREIKDEKYLKLQFIDNGIGIPDFRKETIFNRNYNNKDRTVHGMGIGLSLVKSIIYSYNGYITVEDKEKGDYTKGANFIIHIPEAG